VFHEESWVIVNIHVTSDKVIPEWFFLSFFGFLKSVPDKFGGILCCLWIFCSLFLFVMLCCLWFVYLRCSLCCYCVGVHFVLVLCVCGLLSLYVVICFPIWMELQFCVVCVLMFVGFRFD